jgi:glycosyltransferase involved in cell wall biosynthesis
MKVSVVATVFNEEASIKALLDSLFSQTQKPTEIVIVDGGSTDSTYPILRQYQQKYKILKVLVEKGSIAHGRNESIKHAKYPIIAQTDAGCILHHDWLAKITKPLEDPDIGLVAGFYHMITTAPFQKAAAPFFGTPPHRFDPRNFLPSARSMAFRKKVWKQVGGYDENLDRAGEDTLFNYHVYKAGIKIYREKDAIVDWQVPKNFKEAAKKFFQYAKGDAQAGIWWHPAQKFGTHNIKIFSIFARYLIGLILFTAAFQAPILLMLLIVGGIIYTFWTCWKLEDVVTDMRAKVWIPILQISSDLCVMAGFIAGTIK